MKKQATNTVSNSIKSSSVLLILFISLFLPVAQQAQAQSFNASTNVVISYIGTINGQPVFNVAFDNAKKLFYELAIADDQGTLLYSEKLKDQLYEKKFQLDTPEMDDIRLVLTLTDRKGKQKQVYLVDSNYKIPYVVV
ncbi:MAG TPA: hypothetical protein VM368_02410, partial [Flavisolibacter sp.]|nr:hypothetical protein [Flavisolibacter sp.]